MIMTKSEDGDSFYDSDGELPSLDALLARPSGRIQQQLLEPKPILYLNAKNITVINLEDDDDSAAEDQISKKANSFLDLSDESPVARRTIRKRWQSSPEQSGDDVDDGKRDEGISRSQDRLKTTQRPRNQEANVHSDKIAKSRNNIFSRIESRELTRHSRNFSERVDDADGYISSDQEHPIAQKHHEEPPKESQIRKSGHQPPLSGRKDGKDITRPLSRLSLDFQDGLGLGALDVPAESPKEGRHKKLVSRGERRKREAFQEPRIDDLRLLYSDDEWDEPDISKKTKSAKPTIPKSPSKRQTKKTFDEKKSQLAVDFLQQLDTQITHGKIGELTESTGGVKIMWSNTLKTTAGRANWKRETVVSKQRDGSVTSDAKQFRHHASIELSEKVIDDEHRLLNVIAHEFCHLANFMINGIRDNPHGKEFKLWAAKCSQLFGSQGIKVTTKHTYEIDFKYVWTCTACGLEYKRHSKSIDTNRHRCGACKASLEQTKPTPRQTPAGQLSDYQLFVKEQMKIVKSENPNGSQKEIMRIIADRWAKAKS